MSDADREKWEAPYQNESAIPDSPSPLLTCLADQLPSSGQALDLAGGGGRHAIWLAHRGLTTTLVDISSTGLELARRRAADAGVHLRTVARDLEQEPLPVGPYDLIVSFHYLQRSLFDQFPKALATGGWLVFVQPTKSNLQRHAKPPAAFLLDDGEAPNLASRLDVAIYREGWLEEGRHDALLVARKRAT